MGSETFLEVLLAILLPPVGVFLRYGCGVIPLSSSFSDYCLLVRQELVYHLNPLICFLLMGSVNELQVEFWIDLLLTILGYIPGIIYALYVLVG